MIKKIIVVTTVFLLAVGAYAEKYKFETKQTTNKVSKASERCRAASNKSDLDLNNVRTRINTGGDMWWDLQKNAKYEVPKGSGKNAMYAAALWIGGRDINGQLKVAAQRFRQVGVDFWTGPLTIDGTASITPEECDKWDKHFKMSKKDVEYHRAHYQDPGYVPSEAIANWPWQGDIDLGQTRFLAPFYDADKDDRYDPKKGDYPYYDFDNELCPTSHVDKQGRPLPIPLKETRETAVGAGPGAVPVVGGKLVDQVLKGDATLWWVFNDKGDVHSESKGEPIGLEIRAQAFAFTTNDEINNMTFYTYEIVNRSTYTLTETFFSQWVDSDLGEPTDDYVGCDVERGLGYCYNGKAIDGPSPKAYEGNPPAIGVDFFQGPYLDPDGRDNSRVDVSLLSESEKEPYYKRDSAGTIIEPKVVDTFAVNQDANKFKSKWTCVKDDPTGVGGAGINGVNFGNGIVDDERFGMRRFVYHNNDGSNIGDPSNYTDYYNMLRGIWKDNTRMRYGKNGHNSQTGSSASECDFMFPRKSDIWAWGIGCDKSKSEWISDGMGGGYTREWSEETEHNAYGDRRFMQSAGPFTLKPGAINYITVGIPFAKAESGGPMASVDLLMRVDNKCQQLFDNCFKVLDGPQAPRLVVREMDKTLILYIDPVVGTSGDPVKDNVENYTEKDISIPAVYVTSNTITKHIDSTNVGGIVYYRDTTYVESTEKNVDQFYHFEGYQIYQLRTETVSVADIGTSKDAVLIAQCDIKNFDSSGKAITRLINYTKVDGIEGSLAPVIMADGSNSGLFHTLKVTEDKFATGDRALVNHKKYYFAIVSYAYNEWMPYNGNSSQPVGQTITYLRGRLGPDRGENKPIVGIPHKTEPEQNGTLVRASYGDQPQITRIEGHGNGGFLLDLTDETIKDILSQPAGHPYAEELTYKQGYGPINVRVVDPLNVKPGNFYVAFDVRNTNNIDSASWKLWSDNAALGLDTVRSNNTITVGGEQIVFDLGLAVSITQDPDVSYEKTVEVQGAPIPPKVWAVNNNAILGSSMVFSDSLKKWLSGLPDQDANARMNWIHSGNQKASDPNDSYEKFAIEDYGNDAYGTTIFMDENAQFENMLSGTWAPYRFAGLAVKFGVDPTRNLSHMPGFYTPNVDPPTPKLYSNTTGQLYYNMLNNLYSVRVVITKDQNNWTRCPVIEMQSDKALSEGNADQFSLRKAPSVGKDGQPDGTGTGMGWFPGYAINLETGERLNIMFGENSYETSENGADMIWNPTTATSFEKWGGNHYIYIMGSNGNVNMNVGGEESAYSCPAYDQGAWIASKLNNTSQAKNKPSVYANVMYVTMPIITKTEYLFKDPTKMASDVTIMLNVRKKYDRYFNHPDAVNRYGASSPKNANWPLYRFTTTNLATQTNDSEVAKSALDMINVVPNPYYAFSHYETSQVDNRVRIVNLPQQCDVSIFTVNGTLIRQFKVDTRNVDKVNVSDLSGSRSGDPVTSIDWDLKNHANIPIAGGLYIIHVKSQAGEKIVKFFAAMRPTDLSNFK